MSNRTKLILGLASKISQGQQHHPPLNFATGHSLSTQNTNDETISLFKGHNENHSNGDFSTQTDSVACDVGEVITPFEFQENESSNNYFNLSSDHQGDHQGLSSPSCETIYTPLLPVQTTASNTITEIPAFDNNSPVPTEQRACGFISLTSTCTIADGLVTIATINPNENNNYELNNYSGLEEAASTAEIMASNNVNITESYTIDQEMESEFEDNLPLIHFAAPKITADHSETSYTKKGTVRKRKKARSVEDRNRMKEERRNTLITMHPVLQGCLTSKCRKKCCTFFSDKQRCDINNSFWKLTSQERKSFILTTCGRSETRKKPNDDGSGGRKQNTFKYYLQQENGERREVCKVFFLTTLGFKKTNDRVVHDTLSKTPKNQFHPIPSQQGKARKNVKIDDDLISEHIESFNPIISHYRREHAPYRRYLPSDVSISTMYEDFRCKYPANHISYEAYRIRLKAKNISFTRLGNEECEMCEEFCLHGHQKENLQEDCDVCLKYKKHIHHAENSRKLYREQTQLNSTNEVYVSADLQKVIMLPRIDNFKRVIFAQRLIAYHESFVPLGKKQKLFPFAVIWNESISGRNKEEIVSTFYSFLLRHRDANKITFWLDNCASQNKNWCLFTFFVRMVNSGEISARELIVNYFEPGHTFMSADSFHHQVELSLKKQGKTYDFNDFQKAIELSNNKKVEIKSMSHTDFYVWKDLKSQQKINQDPNHPLLSQMVQVKATRGNYFLEYKTSLLDESFKKLDFLCKKVMKKSGPLTAPVKPLDKPCGFPKEKKQNLLKLIVPLIPDNRKYFWMDLPERKE